MAGVPTWMDWGDLKPKQITTLEAGGLWFEGNPGSAVTNAPFSPVMIAGTPTHLPFQGDPAPGGNSNNQPTMRFSNFDPTQAVQVNTKTTGGWCTGYDTNFQMYPGNDNEVYPDGFLFDNGNILGTANHCTQKAAPKIKEQYLMCRDANSNTVYAETDLSQASNPRCKWVSPTEILKCCTATQSMFPAANQYCAPDYIPGGDGSQCPNYMVNYCTNNWNDPVCQFYLSNVESIPGAAEVITQVVKNYLTNPNRIPQDYCSSKLPNHPCPKGRDDSTDPFFTTVLPKLCYASPISCDAILDQFCAQFTRDDLDNAKGDSVLQRICGCHLSDCQKGQLCHVENQGLNITNTILRPSQYPFPDVPLQCDPICNFAETLPRAGMPQCQGAVCLIDNLTISQINSQGNVTISQACGCTAGQCSCFIDNTVINEVNSQGNICIDQSQCGQCYTYSATNPTNPLRLPTCPSNAACSSSKKEKFEMPDGKKKSGISWWIVLGTVALALVVFFLVWRKRKNR